MTGRVSVSDADDERSEKLRNLLVGAGEAFARGDNYFRQVLDGLPVAVYITDIAGLITYYNDAAVTLWGRQPEIGKNHWCGSWKLYRPDGTPLPHDQCPMAIALREQRIIRGQEALAERPDGVRVPFIAYPTLLHDASGTVIGAVNMLVDITDQKRAEEYAQRLASIVESSDDAIVAKDLNGIITSWNLGAQRLFGYTADETIGQSVTMLIPEDRLDEEPAILARIHAGERVDHYETVRRRKDGTLIDISLTVSPVRGTDGTVTGASKIARDITERRRSHEQEHLLLREMNHRVKNLFALAGSIVTLSSRGAKTPQELATSVGDRLAALARAHELTLPQSYGGVDASAQIATLHSLIRTVVSPYEYEQNSRIALGGADVPLCAKAVSALALLIHEFTTNAAKYGSLSVPTGRVSIDCTAEGNEVVLVWKEQGGPKLDDRRGEEGFGSLMTRAAAKGQLGGTITRQWAEDGLTIRVSMSRERLEG